MYTPINMLSPEDQRRLEFIAHFFPDKSQAGSEGLMVANALNVRARSATTVRDWTDRLYTELVLLRKEEFLEFTSRLGLKYSEAPESKRSILGALYWAHRASVMPEKSGWEGASEEQFSELAYDLGLPILILDIDLRPEGGWKSWHDKRAGVVCTVASKHSMFSGGSGTERCRFVNRVWQQVKRTTKNADDTPTLFRVKDYDSLRTDWDSLDRTGVRLDLEPVNYRLFKGTNDVYQVNSGGFAEEAWRMDLGKVDLESPRQLSASLLANPLSVTACAIARDSSGVEYVGIQPRNIDQVASGKYRYQASAGGFVTHSENKTDLVGGVPDPFLTICREFGEEALTFGRGSPFTPQDVTLFALVRDLASCFEVGLVGEIACPFSYEQALGDMKPGPDAYFEAVVERPGKSPLAWIRFEPEPIGYWLEQHDGYPAWMPFGLAATVFSLIRRYPKRRVINALEAAITKYGRHYLMTDEPDGPPVPDLIRRTTTLRRGGSPHAKGKGRASREADARRNARA